MTKVQSPETAKEHVKHVYLDCVPSKDGKVLTCKRMKPKNTKKTLQKDTVSAVNAVESSSVDTGTQVQENTKQDIPTVEDSSTSKTGHIIPMDACTIDCAESDDEPSDDEIDISTATDSQLVEDGGEDDWEEDLEDD